MSGGVFDPDLIDKEIAKKNELTTAPGFWDDNKNAEKVMNDIKMLKGKVEPWRELIKQIDDIEALYELGMEEKDQSVESEVREEYNKTKAEFDHESILNLLSGEVDRNDAFLSVHAGAGGTEACPVHAGSEGGARSGVSLSSIGSGSPCPSRSVNAYCPGAD